MNRLKEARSLDTEVTILGEQVERCVRKQRCCGWLRCRTRRTQKQSGSNYRGEDRLSRLDGIRQVRGRREKDAKHPYERHSNREWGTLSHGYTIAENLDAFNLIRELLIQRRNLQRP